MAKQITKSALNSALQSHAKDATEAPKDFSKLPGGISGGIAQLIDAKIGTYKTGKMTGEKFIYFAASIVEPDSAVEIVKAWNPQLKKAVVVGTPKNVMVRGRRTSIMMPLCERVAANGDVTSQDDMVAAALNMVRLLAGPDSTAHIASEDDLEALLKSLIAPDVKIYTRFSTSSADPSEKNPNQAVFENWFGSEGLEAYEPPTKNKTEVGAPTQPGQRAPLNPTPAPDVETQEEKEDRESTEEVNAEMTADDIRALAEIAARDNKAGSKEEKESDKAAERLEEIADGLGIDKDAVKSAEGWADVAELIITTRDGDSGDVGADDPDERTVGTVYAYYIMDPKKKKKVAHQVEVLTVDAAKKTATVKDLATGKPMLDGKKKPLVLNWDELAIE